MARTRLFSLAEPHLKINVINTTVRKENKSSIVSGSTSNSRAEKVSRKRKSEKKKEKISYDTSCTHYHTGTGTRSGTKRRPENIRPWLSPQTQPSACQHVSMAT
jgi:hypothetical protein